MISPQTQPNPTQHRERLISHSHSQHYALLSRSPLPLLTSDEHRARAASTPPRAPVQIAGQRNPLATTPAPADQYTRSSTSGGRMNGYRNLASSPPAPSGGEPEPAPSPATAKEGKWEGAAVGAATMVRNLSSASQRFAAVERSKSTSGHRGGGGFQAVVRRAFSMRRQPASSLSEGYWRIHDGLDDGDDDAEAPEEVDEQKKHRAKPEVPGDAAGSNSEVEKEASKKKKKRGHIFKACKKLLGFKRV